jgi:hypothetical protein
MALSSYFLRQCQKYTKKSEQATHSLGVRSFWEWICKIKNGNRGFLEGISVQLDGDNNRQKITSISGKLTLYKSEWRSNIIKFCGWTDTAKKGEHKQLQELCEAVLHSE